MYRYRSRLQPSPHGFTMIELIVIIVVFGIISAVLLPKLAAKEDFEAAGFLDEVKSIISYAQKSAIAARRNVYVKIDTATRRICLTYDVASVDCSNLPVYRPNDNAAYSVIAGTSTNFDVNYAFGFTALGNELTNADYTITVLLNGVTTVGKIKVEGGTGYVHSI